MLDLTRRQRLKGKDQTVGWVTEELLRRLSQRQPRAPRVTPAPPVPSIFGEIAGQMESDVLEYNEACGPQFMVSSSGNSLVQVIPKQPPITTAVIQIDDRGVVGLTCPPAGPGIGRRGTFKQEQGGIVSSEDFVGEPQPSGEPMTPEEFSKFVLGPILFPVD